MKRNETATEKENKEKIMKWTKVNDDIEIIEGGELLLISYWKKFNMIYCSLRENFKWIRIWWGISSNKIIHGKI